MRDDLPADRQRGEAWRTVLPDEGFPVPDEPAQTHLEEQMRHQGRDGLVDPRPECGQLVSQGEAAQRRPDRGRREAVEEPSLVRREGPADERDDTVVGSAQDGRHLQPERQELAATPCQVARIRPLERAGVARRAVAEHQVVSGHWTMK